MDGVTENVERVLRHRVELNDRYLKDKVANVSETMRRFADQIDRDLPMFFDEDPAQAVAQVLNAWANHVNNLRLDLLPGAATNLVLARQALKEWEESSADS